MQNNKKKMRFNDTELAAIKQIFAENEPMLIAVRKRFHGVELTALEQDMLTKTFAIGSAEHNLLRKIFYPELDPSAPLFEIVDMWMTVEIKDKPTDVAMLYIDSRAELCKYLKSVVDNFTSFDMAVPCISVWTAAGINKDSVHTEYISDHDRHVAILTRNALISHVEAHLQQANILAGLKDDSVEATLKKLQQNSAK
jgi:hypothetical protein